ncbi:50S ribosomal protein L15 [bacterium BMS3Abin07]|nr:50S ribosomal protein L15 [bacterium BMS3Abin07]GBE33368.1 50S ribosomal protein L15 [bacterium BMS3Bbin05]HDL20450.1 50S ribosomal protein L15 [Nitrospirota bacterium]HDO21919.1 50S ribosomal protein L15 [Nitrospirota bacterium]HDZ87991.1 50S ribosomal protein L15 [Nitrospirota bacterium]
MRIEDLRPAKGSVKKRKRIGRGPGSGHGKTSTKGHKGQKARSGAGKGAGFEGGQMPMQRRLPKRGFKNYPFKLQFTIVNLRDIAKLGVAGDITPAILIEQGLIKKILDGVKVLGDGEVSSAITVKAHSFSDSARKKIVAAGGKAEVIEF